MNIHEERVNVHSLVSGLSLRELVALLLLSFWCHVAVIVLFLFLLVPTWLVCSMWLWNLLVILTFFICSPFLVYASREGSDEAVRMCMLV